MATKKTSSPKKRARKPKVRLSARKVYVLCAIIFLVCAVSLAVSVFLATPHNIQATHAAQDIPEAVQEQKSAPQVPYEPASPQVSQKEQQSAPAQKVQQTNQPQKSQPKPHSAQASKQSQSAQITSQQKQPQPTQKSYVPPKTPQSKPAPQQKMSPAKPQASKPNPQSTQSEQPAKPAVTQDPFNLPKAKNGATLVFVIDDAGLHVENVRKYTALPFPITISVLPKLAQTKQCAQQIRKDGKELMLHQPMQAINLNINPGAGKISPEMTTWQVASQIKENIAELGGGVKGFNNHEGSLITEDSVKMGAILETAAELGVYFLDSRTTAQSRSREAALERGMHIFERNAPFLDNAVNREEMLAEIKKSLAVANKAGYAIIIGHVDKSAHILPALLAEMYPYLKEKGYRFATPSTL